MMLKIPSFIYSILRYILFCCLCMSSGLLQAQTKETLVPYGSAILRQPADSLQSLWRLKDNLLLHNYGVVKNCFQQWQKARYSSVEYRLRLDWLHARWLADEDGATHFKTIDTLCKLALLTTRSLHLKPLTAEFAGLLGAVLYQQKQHEEAISYLMLAVITEEQMPGYIFPRPEKWHGSLGHLLFDLQEYEGCAHHFVLAMQKSEGRLNEGLQMNLWNTIGLCFLRLQRYAEAKAAFARANAVALRDGNKLWQGIIAGNYGQILLAAGHTDSARLLLQKDLEANMAWQEYRNVANALQWLARIDVLENEPQAALQKVRAALAILHTYPRADYLGYTLYTASDVHRALGRTDSFYYYRQRYEAQSDSLQKASRPNLLTMVRMEINRDEAQLHAGRLESMRQKEILWRNGLIALVILLAATAIGIQVSNKKRLRAERSLAKQHTAMAQLQINAATEKLQLFTQTLLEKNEALAQLESAYAKKGAEPELAALRLLTDGSLLTNEDWERFKSLLDRCFPGFLFRLKDAYPSITPSELRMAALVRLKLNAREMASILGISQMSVYKGRQRLRKRLGVEGDKQADQILIEI